MLRKIFFAMLLTALVGGCQKPPLFVEEHPGVKGQPPEILGYYAAKEIRPGETWNGLPRCNLLRRKALYQSFDHRDALPTIDVERRRKLLDIRLAAVEMFDGLIGLSRLVI